MVTPFRSVGGSRGSNWKTGWRSYGQPGKPLEFNKEQTHAAFDGGLLWRLSVPSTAPCPGLDGLRAIEWGGAQRWYAGEQAAVREAAARIGGHAVLYRAPESLRCLEGAFAPLPPALLALHRRLKKAFDPKGILNPGRLYAEF